MILFTISKPEPGLLSGEEVGKYGSSKRPGFSKELMSLVLEKPEKRKVEIKKKYECT